MLRAGSLIVSSSSGIDWVSCAFVCASASYRAEGEVVGLAGAGLLVETVDLGVAQFARQPETDLDDLVGLRLQVFGFERPVFGHGEGLGILPFHQHLVGLPRRERVRQPFEFRLPLRGGHVVGLHVRLVEAGVREVVGAEHHHGSVFGGSGRGDHERNCDE